MKTSNLLSGYLLNRQSSRRKMRNLLFLKFCVILLAFHFGNTDSNIITPKYCLKVKRGKIYSSRQVQMKATKIFQSKIDTTIFTPVYFVAAKGSGSRWISSMIGGAGGIPGFGHLGLLCKYYGYIVVPCAKEIDELKTTKANAPEILMKIHWANRDFLCKGVHKNEFKQDALLRARNVILIRNPYRSVLSWIQHDRVGHKNSWKTPDKLHKEIKSTRNDNEMIKQQLLSDQVLITKLILFKTGFKTQFLKRFKEWTKLYSTWLSGNSNNNSDATLLINRNILVLFYEDFLKDPKPELEKVLTFLNITTSIDQRIQAVLQDGQLVETGKRKSFSDETKLVVRNYFSENRGLTNRVNRGLKAIEKLLMEHDFPMNLRERYDPMHFFTPK